MDQVRVRVTPRHRDINVEAWGDAPAEVQMMLAEANLVTNLIHVDENILETCLEESLCGAAFGGLPQTGQRLGNNLPRFASSLGIPGNGNHYIGLNLTSPVLLRPWRFLYAYITDFEYPLGAEKTVATVSWRVIPYTQDPYNSGLAAQGQQLWDRTLDT
jgi:hypothetical protein